MLSVTQLLIRNHQMPKCRHAWGNFYSGSAGLISPFQSKKSARRRITSLTLSAGALTNQKLMNISPLTISQLKDMWVCLMTCFVSLVTGNTNFLQVLYNNSFHPCCRQLFIHNSFSTPQGLQRTSNLISEHFLFSALISKNVLSQPNVTHSSHSPS